MEMTPGRQFSVDVSDADNSETLSAQKLREDTRYKDGTNLTRTIPQTATSSLSLSCRTTDTSIPPAQSSASSDSVRVPTEREVS